MTAPFARAWSLNLIDNVLYSTSGRACGEVSDKDSIEYAAAMSGLRRAGNGPLLDASAVNAADVGDLAQPQVIHLFVSRRVRPRPGAAAAPRADPAASSWRPATAAMIRPRAISARACSRCRPRRPG